MSDQTLLELRDIAFERDDRVLFSGLNHSLAVGQILQVTGENGAGKTTLLRLLTTALQPAIGTIFWRGESIATQRYRYLQSLLYIGHQPAVKGPLSVRDNLKWLRALLPFKSDRTIEDALHAVGLFGYEDVPAYSLSAGQHRRVALARLLLADVKLWILDEPFTALDKTGVALIEQLFVEHCQGGGAVVVTSHQDMSIPVTTLALHGGPAWI